MKYLKEILLTGASGTVGKEVLRQLCDSADKYSITVFDLETKHSKSLFKKYRGRINVVYGDLTDKSDVLKICREKDIIIHLAAIIPPLADKQPALAKTVNIGGTRNLIGSVEELSPGAFFLYSSSISVYGDRCSDPFIKIDDPLSPSDRDEYARTKIEAEKIVRDSRLKWSIFRLTAIMGINNHKPSEIMFHMPLDSKMEIATPGDTGRAFIKAIDHIDELTGKTFNLSGGEKCRISYRDFLSRSFKTFGLGKLDFRENSFAGRNFHCGYYEDGDTLNEILDFRRETIEDYFANLEMSISIYQKVPTVLFRRLIKRNLQRKSEPLAAIKENKQDEIRHFF